MSETTAKGPGGDSGAEDRHAPDGAMSMDPRVMAAIIGAFAASLGVVKAVIQVVFRPHCSDG
jgi:hypothetical protein